MTTARTQDNLRDDADPGHPDRERPPWQPAGEAERTGRPVDLIDLKVVAEPLLGQIVRHGRRLLGSDSAYGQLISRHLFEQADFMPYRSRVLAERWAAWTGK